MPLALCCISCISVEVAYKRTSERTEMSNEIQTIFSFVLAAAIGDSGIGVFNFSELGVALIVIAVTALLLLSGITRHLIVDNRPPQLGQYHNRSVVVAVTLHGLALVGLTILLVTLFTHTTAWSEAGAGNFVPVIAVVASSLLALFVTLCVPMWFRKYLKHGFTD